MNLPEQERSFILIDENNKTGLILEGGAMRGLFTAGVLDVFLDNGIKFDGMIGVSSGAAFGSNFKSNQKGRVLRYNVRFCKDPEYCSLRSLIKTGDLYGADFCYRKCLSIHAVGLKTCMHKRKKIS